MLYNWLKNALLGPQPCLLCDADAGYDLALCTDCRCELPANDPACSRCARPLHAPAALCGNCLRRPPPFAAARCALHYAPPTAALVLALKYRGVLAAAPVLGELLYQRVRNEPRPDCLVPIPLHISRLRERGFNQSSELSRVLGRRLGVPVRPGVLVRQRATTAQTGLEARARRRNLAGAFAARDTGGIRRVALVDDVMTTGATAEAATVALHRAGVEHVVVWCAARTPDS